MTPGYGESLQAAFPVGLVTRWHRGKEVEVPGPMVLSRLTTAGLFQTEGRYRCCEMASLALSRPARQIKPLCTSLLAVTQY